MEHDGLSRSCSAMRLLACPKPFYCMWGLCGGFCCYSKYGGRSGVLTPISTGEMDAKEHTVVETLRSLERAGQYRGLAESAMGQIRESDPKGREAVHPSRR